MDLCNRRCDHITHQISVSYTGNKLLKYINLHKSCGMVTPTKHKYKNEKTI